MLFWSAAVIYLATISVVFGSNNYSDQPNTGDGRGGRRKCPKNDCQVSRQTREKATREMIKMDILKKLGMEESGAPEFEVEDNVPAQLLHELRSKHSFNDEDIMQRDQGYREGNDDDDDQDFVNDQIYIVAKNPEEYNVPSEVTDEFPNIQYFPVETAEPMGPLGGTGEHRSTSGGSLVPDSVQKALLLMHLPKAKSADDRRVWVTAYYVEVNAKGPQKIKSQVISADLDLENGGWVNLDVTDPVRRWLKKSEAGFEAARSNHGLIIHAHTASGRALKIGVKHQKKSQAPYIHIFLDRSRSGARVKRNAGYCKVGPESSALGSGHVATGQQQSLNTISGASAALSLPPPRDEIEECCVYHLKVDFKKDYNWTWIISPASFEFNYCNGDCALGTVTGARAHMKKLLEQDDGVELGPTCCTPQKTTGMQILYQDHNKNVILGNLQRMRVDRCGCV